ncbi:MAG: hypothetical protein BroJett042_15530 [Bacteroidota bacterium]|nr:MAG: hypothetical protein UZ12_BCD005000578 [Bacteroidetes bacterium OLB12]GIL23040.1 MAG: hypothetical protein BroJett042_15530 [Bacteroidota bacterium]
MLGGGFLKQSQDSFTYNRELRQEAVKLSMKNSLASVRSKGKNSNSQSLSLNDPIMTASARALLRDELRRENRNSRIRSITILLVITGIILFTLANL